jgi:uncharacterized protein with FMN-binding domain
MKKAPLVLSATLAGLAGVLTFHSHKPMSAVAVHPAPTTPSTTPASPPTTHPTSPGSPAPPATPAPTTTAPAANSSATGTDTQYRYGDLAVTVIEKNGRITDLQMATLNETDSRSVRIDDQAIPLLRQEVLDAQSANINGVSGATYTSQAYATSVQSALDQLGHK